MSFRGFCEEINRRQFYIFLCLTFNIFYTMEKKFYVALAIEIEQIAIEKGFAASTEDPFEWGN